MPNADTRAKAAPTQRKANADEPSPKFVACLCIDLIGSTLFGLNLSATNWIKFNRELVKQIKPHLDKLELNDALIKFTGDGWLVMTEDPSKIAVLCCFATIMAKRFQEEMSASTGMGKDQMPALRLACCLGLDISVVLPNGAKDWAGDSARRAVRAVRCCFPNEILIDDPVRSASILRDFETEPADLASRPPKKSEEQLTLHTLKRLRPGAAQESGAPEFYVYTLGQTGRRDEAMREALTVTTALSSPHPPAGKPTEKLVSANTRQWNRLLARAPDYLAANELFRRGRSSSLRPDVVTYNTLISLAPDYREARSLLKEMREAGIPPDVVTYNTLLSKDLTTTSADDLLGWYLSQPYHPEEPLQAAIASYRKAKRIQDALRVALDYPHLQAARKLMRIKQKEALAYFAAICERDPCHPNGEYARGVVLMELERNAEATPHLRRALELATAEPRRAAIKRWLDRIDGPGPASS